MSREKVVAEIVLPKGKKLDPLEAPVLSYLVDKAAAGDTEHQSNKVADYIAAAEKLAAAKAKAEALKKGKK